MYLETTYEVTAVIEAEDGTTMNVSQPIPTGTKGRVIHGLDVPDCVDLEPGDRVRLCVENHTPKRGWVLDKFIGFPYDRERAGWHPFDGIES